MIDPGIQRISSMMKKLTKNSKKFFLKKMIKVEIDLYEVDMLKSTIQHNEPIILGIFIVQHANLKNLVCHNFADNFC